MASRCSYTSTTDLSTIGSTNYTLAGTSQNSASEPAASNFNSLPHPLPPSPSSSLTLSLPHLLPPSPSPPSPLTPSSSPSLTLSLPHLLPPSPPPSLTLSLPHLLHPSPSHSLTLSLPLFLPAPLSPKDRLILTSLKMREKRTIF